MSIWLRTTLVAVCYAAAIVVTMRLLPVAQEALRIALAFTIVQSVAIAIMLVALLLRRGVAERRLRRSQAIAAEAHDAVAQHAAGVDRLRVLRALQQESARDVEAALSSFLTTTRGSMQERVIALSRDLGVTTRETIAHAADSTLFERALLADATRGRADEIAAREIPRVLMIGAERESIAALELLYAWQRAVTVEGFEHALTSASAQVRKRAFDALPYVNPSRSAHITNGLLDRDPHVRAAAARAAGRLRDESHAAGLEEALRDENADVAVAAAFALAALPDGIARLQHHATERVAFEALEKATLGRLELA